MILKWNSTPVAFLGPSIRKSISISTKTPSIFKQKCLYFLKDKQNKFMCKHSAPHSKKKKEKKNTTTSNSNES